MTSTGNPAERHDAKEAHAMTTTTTTIPFEATMTWTDEDKYAPAHYTVSPVWAGVDRPITSGWSVGTNKALGQRLVRAIMAGVVCTEAHVVSDVNGQTYVEHKGHYNVSGRRMNADLKRLGF